MSSSHVLLVHGIWDTSHKMATLGSHLQREGWTPHAPDLTPCCGRAGLDELAAQLAHTVATTLPPDAEFDLVGFSMGGLISRYYLQRLGGAERVRRFVTLATPHQGTWMAHSARHAAHRQMRPGSAFLRDLASDWDGVTARVQVTSLWTPLDLIIVPAHSSRLPDATERRLWVPTHPGMVRDPRCLREVTAALRAPL